MGGRNDAKTPHLKGSDAIFVRVPSLHQVVVKEAFFSFLWLFVWFLSGSALMTRKMQEKCVGSIMKLDPKVKSLSCSFRPFTRTDLIGPPKFVCVGIF